MNHNKLTLIIFFIAYPIYLDISIEEDVNLIAAIVTLNHPHSIRSFSAISTIAYFYSTLCDLLVRFYQIMISIFLLFLLSLQTI